MLNFRVKPLFILRLLLYLGSELAYNLWRCWAMSLHSPQCVLVLRLQPIPRTLLLSETTGTLSGSWQRAGAYVSKQRRPGDSRQELPWPLYDSHCVSYRRSTSMIADSVSSAYNIEDRLNTDSLAQLLFHEAVVEVGERAKGVLPEYHDRIEQAVQLLLAGEVHWRPDGSVQVQGPEQEDAIYGLQDICACPENAQTPRGWCVHRLAGAIAKRASALVQTRLETINAPLPPEPASTPAGEEGEALGRTAIPR